MIALLALAGAALQAQTTAAQTPAASTGQQTPELPLSPLPKPPSVELGTPSNEELAALDAHLERLTSSDASERETAIREILEVDPGRVPAIHRRLNLIADRADKQAMKKVLLEIRDDARDTVRAQMRARGERGRVKTPDYLDMLHQFARPESKEWKENVKIVSMSRMLAQIGTMEAARTLIHVYVRFGEFLRVDTQLQLQKMGDRALAALIEAQRHPAAKVGTWASRQLDLMGKAIPSEVVQTDDHEVLADVLRAYGRIRDPDAARLIVSFANSERAQIREAARQGVAMLSDVAEWQLRDTFENVVGKKAPREWSWERLARELFTEFDRLRLSRVYGTFDKGKKSRGSGDLDEAIRAFDRVLAQDPLFQQGAEMVPAYIQYAKQHLEDAPADAVRALRRAERLSDDEATSKAAKSLRLTLEAEELLQQSGLLDQVLLRRALDLDPNNDRAQALLDRAQRGEIEKKSRFNRFVAAGAIGFIALLSIALLLLRRPKPPEEAQGGG